MNKLSLTIILLFSFFLSCNAQRTEQKDIVAFNKIYLSGSVDVIYTNSDTLSLTLKGEKTDLQKINIKQDNGALYISNSGSSLSGVKIYLKNNALNYIQSAGSINFKSNSLINCDSMSINSSGASDVKLKIKANKINCIQSGASDVSLTGETKQLQLLTSGASTFKGYNLNASNANVISSGASTAKVNVIENINANASGASNIKIKGEVNQIITEATPGASITKVKKQNNSDKAESDTLTFNWKKKKIVVVSNDNELYIDNKIPEPKSFKHWKGFSVGINGYMNSTGGINLPKQYNYMDLNYSRSFNFQLNSLEQQFNIIDNHFKFIVGLGLDFRLYELSNKTILNADSSFTHGVIDSTNTYTYRKNKLRNSYLQIPLLFELNTSNNPNKTFHLAFGVIGQVMLGASTKQELEQNKFEITKHKSDTYNFNPFAAKAHVNFGYRNWTVYAEYNLTPLFQSGKGPELYPFTAGIRLIPFS